MPFEPIVPEGQHLGTSRTVDGAVVGHLFDDETNDLVGHAAWQWVDEPGGYEAPRDEPARPLTQEEIEQIAQLVALIVTGVAIGVSKAAPHVKRWWTESVVPTSRKAWARVTRRRRSAVAPASTATFVVSSTGVELAVPAPSVTMSAAEWQERFRAMLAAGRFVEEQQAILARATIVEDTERELTAQAFADRVAGLLAANPELLTESTMAELERVFARRSDPEAGMSSQSLRP